MSLSQESLPAGASVLQLSVTDRDSPQNGPPFSYIILKGNEGKPFSVDQRGVIRTTATLKSSEKDQYVLHVQVRIGLCLTMQYDLWTDQ